MGESPLGHLPYRMVKTLREKSMAKKRRIGERTQPMVAQDPPNMVKARLPEPQTPAVKFDTRSYGA
jgi:hypothetical protein